MALYLKLSMQCFPEKGWNSGYIHGFVLVPEKGGTLAHLCIFGWTQAFGQYSYIVTLTCKYSYLIGTLSRQGIKPKT